MYSRELKIPDGVEIKVEGTNVEVNGPKGKVERKFVITGDIKIKKEGNLIKVFSESDRRKVKALIGTIIAHIKNAINGVTKGYIYKLKVVYSHFPITVKVEGDKVLIQNFLGERTPRIAKIVGSAKVEVKGPEITVSGIDKEEVGQTAGNIERACRIVGKDRRRFMDGIWIVKKGE